jgi:hypothetical protein
MAYSDSTYTNPRSASYRSDYNLESLSAKENIKPPYVPIYTVADKKQYGSQNSYEVNQHLSNDNNSNYTIIFPSFSNQLLFFIN